MSSIDIVIPCYRYGRYLRECVQSVLTQGIADLRILILDDASPDETPEVCAALALEDARVSYRRHAVNRGHIDTYNEGIDWTRADYMLLLSADDYLLPGALRRAMALMDSHPEIGFSFGDSIILTDSGASSRMRANIHDSDTRPFMALAGIDFIRLLTRRGPINFYIVPTPTAVVRTSVQKRLGGYRKELPHCGDLEMWLRFAAHSSVGYLRLDQAVSRIHGGNMSLGYFNDNGLMYCLEQHKTAFDTFLQTCGHSMPEADQLYHSLLQTFAIDTVGHASSAFNNDRFELSRRLCDFALSLDPGVRRSAAWNALACKQLMGPGLSSMLRPAVTLFRTAASKILG